MLKSNYEYPNIDKVVRIVLKTMKLFVTITVEKT